MHSRYIGSRAIWWFCHSTKKTLELLLTVNAVEHGPLVVTDSFGIFLHLPVNKARYDCEAADLTKNSLQ